MIRRRLRFRSPQTILRLIKPRIHLEPKASESIRVESALGRILAEDVRSTLDVPSFVRPFVDGYATRAAWTRGASFSHPVTLRVAGKSFPEDQPNGNRIGYREAFYLACGAPVPQGADCMVKVEDTRVVGAEVHVLKEGIPRAGLSRPGEDVRRGSRVLRRGDLVRPQDLGVLVALGKREVNVFPRPKLAILSVGDEIVSLDDFAPNRIVNNYAHVISAATSELGATPILLGIAPDDPDAIAKRLVEGAQVADAVTTIGGCSVGAKDFVPDAIAKVGDVIAHGVKIKPGHVAGVGTVRNKPVFMLPGHVASSLMAFYLFVVPTLAIIAGIKPHKILPTSYAEMTVPVDEEATHTFLRLRLSEKAGRLVAEPIHGGTNILSSLSRANGFALIPPRTSVRKGQTIRVTLFSRLEHTVFN